MLRTFAPVLALAIVSGSAIEPGFIDTPPTGTAAYGMAPVRVSATAAAPVGVSAATMAPVLASAITMAAARPSVTGIASVPANSTFPSVRTSATDSAAIHEQSRAFSAAYERGDIDAMMAMYTEDAVIFPGNAEMIRGHEDLRSYWALAPGRRITHHEATPTAIRVEGDMASDYGVYEISGVNGGEAWGPFQGKYLIVWHRGSDGRWRMHLDMWNSRSGDAQPEIDCAEMAARSTFHAACVESVDLSGFFEGMDGTFVLYDAHKGTARVHGRSRARERFLPASTFKILNAVIALEAGTASGPDYAIAWDSASAPPQAWWPESWKREHTLESALRNSVVWYYQEIARRTGEETMQRWLDRLDYGNRDIRGSIDRFWLRGPLSISPIEQVTFLDRFYKNELGISDRTTQAVKQMLVLEDATGYVLSGKTGTADMSESRALAWLVGYVEVGDGVYPYALNMEGERVWEDWPPQNRLKLVKDILRELQAIPPAAE